MYLALRDMPVVRRRSVHADRGHRRIRRRHGRRLQYAGSHRGAAGPRARPQHRAPANGESAKAALASNCARSAACSDFSAKIPASFCAARPRLHGADGRRAGTAGLSDAEIEAQIAARIDARKAKNCAGIGPDPRRAGGGGRDPRGQAGRNHDLAAGLAGDHRPVKLTRRGALRIIRAPVAGVVCPGGVCRTSASGHGAVW